MTLLTSCLDNEYHSNDLLIISQVTTKHSTSNSIWFWYGKSENYDQTILSWLEHWGIAIATRVPYCLVLRAKQREIPVTSQSLMRSRKGSHQQNGMISSVDGCYYFTIQWPFTNISISTWCRPWSTGMGNCSSWYVTMTPCCVICYAPKPHRVPMSR